MSFRATNDLSGPRPCPADPAAGAQRTAPIALLVFAGLVSWATPLTRVEAAPLSGFTEGPSTRRTTSPALVVIMSQEFCCLAQVWRAAEQRIAAEPQAGGFVTETSSSTVFGKDRARRQGGGPWETGPWAVRGEFGMRGNSVSEYVLLEARATATFQPHRNAALDLSLFSSLWGYYEYLTYEGLSDTHRLGYAGGRLTARWVIVSGGRWRPSIGVTAGPIYIYTREQQLGSDITEHHGFWAADVSATAQLAFGVTRTFWVRLSAELGNLFPTRDISAPWITQDHPNPRVASFGRPFMWSAGLAIELKIP